jgi:hypothetical protein
MAILRYLVGPELIWILFCIWAGTLKHLNVAREGHYNKLIESYAQIFPVLVLAVTMVLYAFPWVPRNYLLLRIAIAALIGTHFLLERTLNAHVGGGPGVGMIYLVGYIILLFAIPLALIFKGLVIK